MAGDAECLLCGRSCGCDVADRDQYACPFRLSAHTYRLGVCAVCHAAQAEEAQRYWAYRLRRAQNEDGC